MKSKFHERAIARVTPEERALMVKSLEILSQIHNILERQGISQKRLSQMMRISEAAVSKMLHPGGNLGIATIVRLEVLLGEPIILTSQRAIEFEYAKSTKWNLPPENQEEFIYAKVNYQPGESRFLINP